MIFRRFARTALIFASVAIFAAPALAQQAEPTDAAAAKRWAYAPTLGWDPADWDLQESDFQPEDGWIFGKLDNGMRYIIRRNDRPEGTALVRMMIKTGSIDERDEERGFAHYVEHMAFNGSTNVPEGEMVKLLEREGLAFGADTNASTGFDRTEYKLDLPRSDEKLLDTALMLMRETASELTISPEAVERERGVILSERRVRNTYNLKNLIDGLQFAYPEARLPNRLPIGTLETLEGATAEGLRGFWQREYVPGDTVVVVIGDFDPAAVEGNIRARFASWQAQPVLDQTKAGPVDFADGGRTAIYLDPALTENVTLAQHGPYLDQPDTIAQRRSNVLRSIGEAILSRRLQRLLRSEDPPFRGANMSTGDFFEEARTTQISVATEDGKWQRGLAAAIEEYRRAMEFGFTDAEIAEQVSTTRTAIENAVSNMATRTNTQFLGQAGSIVRGDQVPDDPRNALERFNAVAKDASPENVLAAFRDRALDLDNPLIRFSGRTAPEGGAAALRAEFAAAFIRSVSPPEDTPVAEFAYTDFGTPGAIISDMRTGQYDIRTLRFANGVMLNLKQTDLSDDRISIRIAVDGGDMLATRDNPQATALAGLLTSGGLGKHSLDELQSILAGKSVSPSFSSADDAFVSAVTTTPRDFELQLQLLTAIITDPGYRAEGLGPWRKSLTDFYARLGKTPDSAYSEARGARLTDSDPRFVRPPITTYQNLDYSQLQGNIAERLANGAIEIAIVGDFDETRAIDYIARTFGALAPRETAFRPYEDVRASLTLTQDRSPVTIMHDGEADQAMVRYVWLTTDDTDWTTVSQFGLLQRIVQLMLTDTLREELGQTYSPFTNSTMSDQYDGYGTFEIGASVDVGQIDATRAALDATMAKLLAKAPDDDLMNRARQPIYESLDNRLKTNGGWMALAASAQSDPDQLERFATTRARYEAMTGEDMLALARTYLQPEAAIPFIVRPSAASASSQPVE